MGHIHIDAVGGAAGDMFVAALTDAFPEFEGLVLETVGGLRLPRTAASFEKHADTLFQGRRFRVMCPDLQAHGHKPFAAVKQHIYAAAIPSDVKEASVAIFTLLAEAEAYVHRVPVEDVEFHEVGAWDSMADIVAAATLIDAVRNYSWSIGVLPLGGGRVQTQHGLMSVPAPATTRLMRGFDLLDDGVKGERVTPTGMAILAFLRRHHGAGRARGRLERCGIGFGTRRLPGMSNVLRALIMEDATCSFGRSDVFQLTFDIDDQTAEDLAVALDRIGGMTGVLSIVQLPAFGKKCRVGTQVQILSMPDVVEEVTEACLRETRTLGLRVSRLERFEVARDFRKVSIGGEAFTVKVARRPGQLTTAKVEVDDLRGVETAAKRDELRQEAEQIVLRKARDLDGK